MLITDDAVWSNYFNVTDVPDTLTSGKNMFKISGNHGLLQKNSEIIVEVLDRWGKPVFHTVNDYLDDVQRRMVTVWVYPTVAAGPGWITIVGQAKRRPRGKHISEYWKGRPNVRWRKKIFINPNAMNTTPIIYPNGSGLYQTINQGNPRVAINEIVRTQVSNSYVQGTASLTSMSVGHVSYNIEGGQHGSQGKLTFNFDGVPTNSFTSESYKLTSEMVGSSITIQPGGTDGIWLNAISPASPPEYIATIIDVLNEHEAIVSPRYRFTSQFQATPTPAARGQDALQPLPYNQTLDSLYFGDMFSQSNSEKATYTMSYMQTPKAYETVSENLTSYANVILANLDPLAGDVSVVRTYTRLTGTSMWQLQGEDTVETKEMFFDSSNIFDRQPMGKFETQSIVDNYWTASWSSSLKTTAGAGYQYGGAIPTLKADDIHIMDALKVSASIGQEFISESFVKLEAQREVPVYAGSSYLLSLRLAAKSIAYTASGGPLDLTNPTYQNTGSTGSVYSGSGEFAAIPEMRVYISGSAITPDTRENRPLEEKLGKHIETFVAQYQPAEALAKPPAIDSFGDPVSPVWASPNYHKPMFHFKVNELQASKKKVTHGKMLSVKAAHAGGMKKHGGGGNSKWPFSPVPTLAQRPNMQAAYPEMPVIPMSTPTYELNERVIGLEFTADKDGYARPIFAIENGEWYIADVSITAMAETGFTPNHAMIESQLTLEQQDAKLDFKFEFYDGAGNMSDYVHVVPEVDFGGSNLFINGNENHLAGTMIVGNGIIIQGRISAA